MILRTRVPGVFVAIVVGVGSATVAAFAQPMPIPEAPPSTTSDAGAVDAAPAESHADGAAATTPLDGGAATPVDAAVAPVPSSSAAPPPATSAPSAAPAPSSVPAAPPESEPSPLGFNFGFRAGYSFPFGGAKTVGLSDVVGGAVAFGVELGYFLDRHLYIGGNFQYGFGTNVAPSGVTCPTSPDDSCSASVVRFGVMGRYFFRPTESLDPWAGVGIGYDVVNLTETASDGTTVQQGSLHGFELLNLQGGFDFKPRPFYGLGPYMELSIGHYAYDGSSTQLHEWLSFGLRLRTGV